MVLRRTSESGSACACARLCRACPWHAALSYRFAMTVAAQRPAEARRRPRRSTAAATARLVRPPSPRAAVAREARRDGRSLPGLALGDHAAADHREGGRALFRALPRALAGCRALAAAPLDDVLRLWAGLGYYARARNLHACAQRWSSGTRRFSATEAELVALPGIGRYTAAAIAAIAFDAPAVPVDGNVERVVARLFAVEDGTAGGQAGDPPARAALRPTRAPAISRRR